MPNHVQAIVIRELYLLAWLLDWQVGDLQRGSEAGKLANAEEVGKRKEGRCWEVIYRMFKILIRE